MSLTETITEGTLDGILIEEFTDFYYDEYAGQLNEIIHLDSPSLTIDYDVLHDYDEDLASGLINDPIEYYYSAREALRTLPTNDDADQYVDGAPYDPIEDDDPDNPNPLAYADLRVINNPNTKTISELRADDVTTMVSIEGRVKKKTQVQPRVDVAVFKCTTCGDLHYEKQPLVGQMITHDECNSCSSQTVFDWHASHHVNFERLEVEESPEGLSGGETPETIEFYNRGDTTGRVNPGERVTVTGILEPADDEDQGGPAVIFDTRINGNNIVREEEAFEDLEITDEDIETIKELASSDDIYERVRDSIAPAIYGYDMQKFALALGLFGGVKKEVSGSYVRGDIHSLLVGDPGTGKSLKISDMLLNEHNKPETIKSFVERFMNDPEEDEDGDLIDTVDEYIEIPSLGPEGQVERRPVEAVWKKQAPDTVYEVVTESGKRVTVSETHPLFVHNGAGGIEHAKVHEIDEGMAIAAPRNLPTLESDNTLSVDYNPSEANDQAIPISVPERWTPWLARFIGLCIAEGHHNKDGGGITNEDDELLELAQQGYSELGLNPVIYDTNTKAKEVSVSSVELYKFLEGIEEDIVKKSPERSVPDSLFSASDEIKREFVKAYVDGECHPEDGLPELGVSSGSRELLEGVQTLLLSLDIRSQIHEKKTQDGYDNAYSLRMTGDDYRRYVEEVGFVTERKAAMAVPEERSMSNTNTDVIPRGGEVIREVRETMAMAQGDLGLPRTTVLGYENEGKDPARSRAKVVAEAFERRLDELERIATSDADWTWEEAKALREDLGMSQPDVATAASFSGGAVGYHEQNNPDEVADAEVVEQIRVTAAEMHEAAIEQVHKFAQLARSDIAWERVERIEEVDYEHEWMYDLQVEGTHAYIANNLFNHNSQLLEYAHDIAPRGVYTSGKGSSSAGLCVGGDTFIETADGFERIDSIAPEELRRSVSEPTAMSLTRSAATYDTESDEFIVQDTSKAWKMPKQETVEITTERGKDVTVSADTPVLVYREDGVEWVAASDVDASDTLVQSPPQVSERRSLDPYEFYEFDNEMFDLSDSAREAVREALASQFGSLRAAARQLSLPEDFIYDTLSDRFVPYPRLSKVLNSTGYEISALDTDAVSVQHGDTITLPDDFDRELMWLIGVVFGDGNIGAQGERGLVRVTNSDRELLERCADIMGRKFGKRPEIEEGKEDRPPYIRLYSKTIQRFFENLGMVHPKDGSLSLASELTVAEDADALLAGLFDTDGSVNNRSNGSEQVSFISVSEDLAKQVQLMLETYDVYARIRKRDKKGERNVTASGREIVSQQDKWVVDISGADVDRFADAVGFTIDAKQSVLDDMYEAKTRRTRSQYAGAEGLDVVLEPIASVSTGEEELFDLTVPETHSFFGNGLCIHNTAAAVQEESLSGETTWTLEAGALPLADQGIAAIDEIDKMDDGDRDSLHEALESQTISINKAGINATLKARASVMAAANPKYGEFDQFEAVSEQIELDPALISRFDLIFTITDDPDEDRDEAIAGHIIKTNQAEQRDDKDDDVTAAIEPGLFRKYVAYARNNCFPTLPDDVGDYLKEYYVELRQKGDEGVRPATARQLQGLVRLAEASARIRLSDEVTMEDAELAKNVIEASMEDVAMDPETGEFDADIVEAGVSSSQRDRLKTVKQIIETLQDDYDEGVPKEEIYDMATDNIDDAMSMEQLESTLEQLHREGEIYEPREGQYKVMV